MSVIELLRFTWATLPSYEVTAGTVTVPVHDASESFTAQLPSVERWGAPRFTAVTFGNVSLVLLYGMAWYTTRKPNRIRSNCIVAASAISLI